MEQENSPTPTETAATPATEPAYTNGTAQDTSAPNGAVSDATSPAEQAAPDETFTSVDVKSLPPELKAKYDSMLSDYKRKTSEVAQRRRDIEASEKKVKAYDQISSDPAFVEYWNGLTKTQQTQAREEAGISNEEFNKAFESPDNFRSFVQKIASGATAQSQTEITNLKADLMIKDFKSRNPDFDDLNEDKAIEIQIKADPRSYSTDPKLWEKAMTEAIQNVRRVQSKWIEKGRKEGLSRVNEKLSQSTNPPTASPEQLYPGGDPKNLSVAEAADLARRGIKVPRT